MKHPISQKTRYLLVYFGIWSLITAVHIANMHIVNSLSFYAAFIDATISNGLFSLVGLALWYPVLYTNSGRLSYVSLIVNHVSILCVVLIFWISTLSFFSNIALKNIEEYVIFIERSKLSWRIFTGIFYYVLIVMVYYLYIYAIDLQMRSVQESKLKEKIKEAELQTLKSQINPHFLFNGLNSISSLTLSDPERAHDMIIKLSGFLRYSLAHDPNKLIPLKSEIENMESYVAVEKTRFGDKLIFEKEVCKGCDNKNVPFLILQPLIENAIKHGVYESTKPVVIKLFCKETTDDKLLIAVSNNFDPDAVPRKGTGTGIKNIKERLKIIYQMDELLTIKKTDNYFEVTLVIPKA